MESLRMLTQDFEPVGETAAFTNLVITRRHYGVGEFQVNIPYDSPYTSELEIDRMLMPAVKAGEATVPIPHKTLLIESLAYDEAKGDIVVKGCTLDGISKRQLAVPPPIADGTFGWDRVPMPGMPDVPVETVFKHFAHNNLVDPPNPIRAVQRVSIAPDLGRGILTRGQARFEQLSVLLKGLAEYADMGWTIIPDPHAKELVFDVVPGRDLTVGNPSETHVILSAATGNVSAITHTIDTASMRNVAYVGGQGEDELRLILSVGEQRGLARREVWIDGGSLELPDELMLAGRRKLEQTEVKNIITCTAQRSGAFQFERDFDLGDRVTIQMRTGRMDARVIEAKETYARNKPDSIQLTFGASPVSMTSVLMGIQNTTVR